MHQAGTRLYPEEKAQPQTHAYLEAVLRKFPAPCRGMNPYAWRAQTYKPRRKRSVGKAATRPNLRLLAVALTRLEQLVRSLGLHAHSAFGTKRPVLPAVSAIS